jgi:endonuclease G
MLIKIFPVLAFLISISGCIDGKKVSSFQASNEAENVDLLSKPIVEDEEFCGYDKLNDVFMNETSEDVRLVRSAYLSSYNLRTKCPNYVSWKLNSKRLEKNVKRSDRFNEDKDIDEDYRITHSDYSRSGYDRGHMCPAADNRYDAVAMEECFLMTNMCPQTRRLNAGDWNDLEELCRNWAEAGIDVYIVCGPIFRASSSRSIGGQGRKISVPDSFFKVVLLNDANEYNAIGFIMNNNDDSRDLSEYIVSVDFVEEITGYDFFHNLPDDIESVIEKLEEM